MGVQCFDGMLLVDIHVQDGDRSLRQLLSQILATCDIMQIAWRVETEAMEAGLEMGFRVCVVGVMDMNMLLHVFDILLYESGCSHF